MCIKLSWQRPLKLQVLAFSADVILLFGARFQVIQLPVKQDKRLKKS